ncbi:MAG: 50S ribosomal protein L17 [Parcubacteria group bacterium]|nr:50S ribosomal protein L17 [Parcubacteria group bacterium]
MRHRKQGRKFGRQKGQRRAFLKGLAHNLIMKERIATTEARAKEIRPRVEKLVTLAKKQNLASFRLLLARLPEKSAQKLYYDIAPRYRERKGGYLRLIKGAKRRKRDAAQMSVIEFV